MPQSREPRRHMNQNGTVRFVECPICKSRYYRRRNLIRLHMDRIHGIRTPARRSRRRREVCLNAVPQQKVHG